MDQIQTPLRKIYKYGLLCIKDNKILLCEPHGFPDLILPGGLIEGQEKPSENFIREISEELGESAILDLSSLKYIGEFEDRAAGKIVANVIINLWQGSIDGPLVASSEIKALHWFDPKDDWNKLSPIIRNKILPKLISDHILRL